MKLPTYRNTVLLLIFCYFLLSLQLQAQEVGSQSKHAFRGGLLYYTGNSALREFKVEGDAPLGFFFGYKNRTYDVTRFFLQVQYSSGTKTYASNTTLIGGNIKSKVFFFLTGADFHYLRWETFSIYSGIAMGIGNIDVKLDAKTSSSIVETDFSSVVSIQGIIPLLQLKLLCLEINLNETFSLLAETTIGTDTFFNASSVGLVFGMNYHL